MPPKIPIVFILTTVMLPFVVEYRNKLKLFGIKMGVVRMRGSLDIFKR